MIKTCHCDPLDMFKDFVANDPILSTCIPVITSDEQYGKPEQTIAILKEFDGRRTYCNGIGEIIPVPYRLEIRVCEGSGRAKKIRNGVYNLLKSFHGRPMECGTVFCIEPNWPGITKTSYGHRINFQFTLQLERPNNLVIE